jgi:hypothetical protein
MTNDDGSYKFSGVPAGRYTVVAHLDRVPDAMANAAKSIEHESFPSDRCQNSVVRPTCITRGQFPIRAECAGFPLNRTRRMMPQVCDLAQSHGTLNPQNKDGLAIGSAS